MLRVHQSPVVATQRQAALALLSLVAVVLAASLFPATGFGPHPGGGAAVPGSSDGSAGESGPSSGPGDVDGRSPTPTGTPTPTPTPTPAQTPTAEDTSAPSTTEAGAGDGDESEGDRGGPDIGSLVTLVLVLSAVAGLFVVAVGADGDSGPGGADGDAGTVGSRDTPHRAGSLLAPIVRLLPPPLAGALRTLAGTTTALLVTGAMSVPTVLSAIGRATRAVVAGLEATITAIGRPLGRAVTALPRALGGAVAGAGGGLLSALSALPGSLTGLGRGLTLPRRDRNSSRPTPTTDGRETTAAPAASGWLPPETVREAWRRLRATVGARRRSLTPGEVAGLAVERGRPADAVVALTQTFREVRYGGIPGEDRLAAARDALRRIETDDGDSTDADGAAGATSDDEYDDGPGPGSGGDDR
jgi:hypothetical protein